MFKTFLILNNSLILFINNNHKKHLDIKINLELV